MKPLSDDDLNMLLSSSHSPAPSAGFEERILNAAFAHKQKNPFSFGDFTEWLKEVLSPSHRWQLSGALAVLVVMIASGTYLLPTAALDDDGDSIESAYTLDDADDFLEI